MANYSESASPTPAEEPRANWHWLQQRLRPLAMQEFECWLSAELALIEDKYAALITVDSRNRALRNEFSSDRQRGSL